MKERILYIQCTSLMLEKVLLKHCALTTALLSGGGCPGCPGASTFGKASP